jgi:hypothetical protein
MWAVASTLQAQDFPSPANQPASVVRDIRITGTRELSEQQVLNTAGVRIGDALPAGADTIARTIELRYRNEGYSFASVQASFDEQSGTLMLTVDEGVIDEVEFTGAGEALMRSFARDFALRAGDVFHTSRAAEALEALLRPTRGAIRPGRPRGPDAPVAGQPQEPSGPFAFVDKNGGRRVLLVGVRQREGTFRLLPNLGDREDWFSAVDGFVPSIGFGAAVFDHRRFNHAYIAGHLSYKMSPDRVGYALGFERPLLSSTRLYLGGEVHDLTATDDTWRVSSLEASLDAIAARKSFRDYYRRRGVQVHAAVRVQRQIELLFAWRGERHEPLLAASDFSIWNGDERFRTNLPATDGRLNALVIGASVDSHGFDRDSLAATYQRHQLEAAFGERLRGSERGDETVWRVDWTSELSAPDALGSDFDFQRHIVAGRVRRPLSPHQELRARALGGWSSGDLPPQRMFAIGGIGSVHGYEFKEATGDGMALMNLEYALGRLSGPHIVAFFDAGRVSASRVNDTRWLKGAGLGLALSDGLRVDFGYRLDDIPDSLQVLLRFGRTF